MGAKNEANRAYRAAIKAGTFKGTFNEFTGGRYSLRGGATAARQERLALERASENIDEQIRQVGGDPSNFTLEQKMVLDANAQFAFQQRKATTTVGVDDTLDDVAGREGVTTEDFLAANPAMFPMISGGQDQAVFAGQQLNVPAFGLPAVQGPQQARDEPVVNLTGSGMVQGQPQPLGGMTRLDQQLTGFGLRGLSKSSPITGGRGRAQGIGPGTPTGGQLPEGFIGSQLDFSGLSTVSLPQATRTQAAPATVPEAGRLTQTQSARVLETTGDPSVSGTIEEILSRNPETSQDALLDAFASPTFTATLAALETNTPPTYLDEKTFNALVGTQGVGTGMAPQELAEELVRVYEQQPLMDSSAAYWLTGTPEFANTSAGPTTGANAYVDIQGIRRGINRMLRSAVGGGSGGGGIRGTNNTSRGFTPVRRSVMWRIG